MRILSGSGLSCKSAAGLAVVVRLRLKCRRATRKFLWAGPHARPYARIADTANAVPELFRAVVIAGAGMVHHPQNRFRGISRLLRNAILAFFNLAKCGVKLGRARKRTSYLPIAASSLGGCRMESNSVPPLGGGPTSGGGPPAGRSPRFAFGQRLDGQFGFRAGQFFLAAVGVAGCFERLLVPTGFFLAAGSGLSLCLSERSGGPIGQRHGPAFSCRPVRPAEPAARASSRRVWESVPWRWAKLEKRTS